MIWPKNLCVDVFSGRKSKEWVWYLNKVQIYRGYRVHSHSELLWSSLSLRNVLIHSLSKAISMWSTEVSLVQVAGSAAPPRRRKRVIRRDQMIAKLKHGIYSQIFVSTKEYVSAHTDL